MSTTYTQDEKKVIRHNVIKSAVEMLTLHRNSACCVRRSYVRDLYEYFIDQPESHDRDEAQKIDINYIREWERIHANEIGYKKPSELSVCYLSGPEPTNDFNEFISLGVLPQNIWAFECENGVYKQAIYSIDCKSFMQPKLIRTSIERFFENSPKKFDIVYIDACATLISDQHALRCISSMFNSHRLNSPGILISNFSGISNNPILENSFTDIIARYNYLKKNPNPTLVYDNSIYRYKDGFTLQQEAVAAELDRFYGDFVTAMVCNVGAITVPITRFMNSSYLRYLSLSLPKIDCQATVDYINSVRNNTLLKFFATNELLRTVSNDPCFIKTEKLLSEMMSGNPKYDFLASMKKIHAIRVAGEDIQPSLNNVITFFEDRNCMYQFLDKPSKTLFYDLVINQLSYPMHAVCDCIRRYTYIAKQKRMYTDMIVFDECRYLYDWLPAIDQIPDAFSNVSWQYTFRFALDGLIKQRLNYNNEFFFQGSVVPKTINGFEAKVIPERIEIN